MLPRKDFLGIQADVTKEEDLAAAISAAVASFGGVDLLILNAGIWDGFTPWPAIGCGLKGGYGAVWFGDAKDPQSP